MQDAPKSSLAVIFLTVTLDLIGFGMVVPMLPLYARAYGASGTAVAFLFASYSLMQFFFAPLWGQLSDRLGRRPVLLASIGANIGALLLYAAASNFWTLVGARLLAGICTANISVANAYVADVTAPGERARGMGMIGAAFGIGFVVGPFVGGEMSTLGTAVPPLAAAALSAVNLLAAYFRLPESLPAARRNAPRPPLVLTQRLQALRRGEVRASLLSLLFLQVLGFSMMEMSLVLFTHVRLGYEARQAGRLFGVVGLVLVIVQGGLLGRLAKRFGEAALVRLGSLSMFVGMWLVPFVSPAAPALLFLAVVCLSFGQGVCGPSLNSLLSRDAAAEDQGAALGVGQSVAALARVVGPQVGGLAFDHGGENMPFWVGGASLAVAAAIALGGLRAGPRGV